MVRYGDDGKRGYRKGGMMKLGLMTTEDAYEKGFYAAIDGVKLNAGWMQGGNPYNDWDEEKPFWGSWRKGWLAAQ